MTGRKSRGKANQDSGPKVVQQIVLGQGGAAVGATLGGDADDPPPMPAPQVQPRTVLSKVEQAAKSGASPDPELYQKFLQQMMSGKLAAEELSKADVDPEVQEIAEFLSVLNLPEWHTPNGRKLADPTRIEMRQSLRVAQYMHDSGFRFHEDLRKVRWEDTPGGGGPHDLGTHVWRNADGSWPALDPEEIFDLESISLDQDPQSGEWVASHPCGLFERNASKVKAHAGLSLKLAERIDAANAERDGE